MAGFVAVLVGYTSSAAIIFQAAAAAGATPAQIGGWLSALGIAMGVTSLGLSLYYRTPILTAWSTPGAALLVTSLPGTPINEAIGVFIFASGLILLCGVTGLFARLMDYIPQAISAAMLAGILLRFGLDAFASLQLNFPLSAGMGLAYLLSRRYQPRYAIVLTLAAGLAIAALQGNIQLTQHVPAFAMPEFTAPHFSWPTLLGIGVPFFVVTMASQNAPGIATLQAAGYRVPYVTADRLDGADRVTAGAVRRLLGVHRRDHRRYLHGAGRASRSAAALYGRGGRRRFLPAGRAVRRRHRSAVQRVAGRPDPHHRRAGAARHHRRQPAARAA